MKIVSIHIGRVQRHADAIGSWETATFKTAVAGKQSVTRTGFAHDQQADPVNHGGPDKAVLGYAVQNYPAWQQELEIPAFDAGALGENLCLAGVTEAEVCLGDRYRAGGVVLEVSQPRQPCWKQARRWGVKDLVVRIVNSGRTGWYFRVIEEGELEAGQQLTLESRPHPDWTVARANEIFHHRKQDRSAMEALRDVPTLSASWKRTLEKRLAELAPD